MAMRSMVMSSRLRLIHICVMLMLMIVCGLQPASAIQFGSGSTSYPTALDTAFTLTNKSGGTCTQSANSSKICAELHNDVQSAVIAIQTNLGTGTLTKSAGGLVYSTAAGLAIQTAGTSGYFARSGGTGAPTWLDLFGTANTFTADQYFKSGAPWVDVKGYGAVGDNVTDDTTAIQNALTAAGALTYGGAVYLPPGNYKVTATLTIPAKVRFMGAGREITTLTFTNTTTAGLSCRKNNFIIEDMTLVGPTTPLSGSNGIDTLYKASSPATGDAQDFVLSRLRVTGFYNNIQIDSSVNSWLDTIQANNAWNYGINGLRSQGKWTRISVLSNVSDGLHLAVPTVGDGGGVTPFINNFESFANGGWGINTTIGLMLNTFYVNNDSLGEIRVAGTGSQEGFASDGYIQFAGDNPWASPVDTRFPTDAATLTSPGVLVTSGSGEFALTNVRTFNNNGIDIDDSSGDLTVADSFFQGAGVGAQAGNILALKISGGGARIIGNRTQVGSLFAGNNSVITGNKFENNHATLATVEFSGTITEGTFTDNTIINNNGAGVAVLSSGTVTILRRNNRVLQGSITAGADSLAPQFSSPVLGAGGGTGVANGASATLTLPNAATTITGGGTLALGGFTATVPATDTVAMLGVANVFTANQTISNTAPSFILTDTTASAKSLTAIVDANVAQFRESAGASGSLLNLDLANNRVGIGTTTPAVYSGHTSVLEVKAPASTHGGVTIHTDASWIGGLMFVHGGDDQWSLSSRGGAGTPTYSLQLASLGPGAVGQMVTFMQTGLVGIGQATPLEGLHMGATLNIRIPNIKSTTGVRYVCVNTDGNLTSQAAACVGT